MTPLARIVDFLNGIGIACTPARIADASFLPGVRVSAGALVYDRDALRWPGDLLHEAGHIATTPASLRPTLHDDVALPAGVLHASEVEATAWAFAAICHLGLDPDVLFHEGGYHGASAGLVATYAAGVYPGAFGLAQAGMTHIGDAAREQGLPVYPAMSRWLRDQDRR